MENVANIHARQCSPPKMASQVALAEANPKQSHVIWGMSPYDLPFCVVCKREPGPRKLHEKIQICYGNCIEVPAIYLIKSLWLAVIPDFGPYQISHFIADIFSKLFDFILADVTRCG